MPRVGGPDGSAAKPSALYGVADALQAVGDPATVGVDGADREAIAAVIAGARPDQPTLFDWSL